MGKCNWGDERLPQRFWDKVSPEPNSGCWLWIGGVNHADYGKTSFAGKHLHSHRLAYLMLVGPIASGMHIDHLCRNTFCCNPAHLEAVTPRENTIRGIGPTAINARATHCSRGHAFTDDNIVRNHGTERMCKVCHREKTRRYRAKMTPEQHETHLAKRRAAKELKRAAARVESGDWPKNGGGV